MTKRKGKSVSIPMTGIKVRQVLAMVVGTRGDRKYYGEAFVDVPFSTAKGLDAVKAVEAARV